MHGDGKPDHLQLANYLGGPPHQDRFNQVIIGSLGCKYKKLAGSFSSLSLSPVPNSPCPPPAKSATPPSLESASARWASPPSTARLNRTRSGSKFLTPRTPLVAPSGTPPIYTATLEELIGKWFKRTGKRDDIFLASKFGFTLPSFAIDGSPAYVKTAVESSLKKLGVDHIDFYYLHKADTKTAIEHTVGAMAEFDKAGKIKHLGLSEVSAATLRRAHAIHPISAVQVEYSPFTLDIEDPKIGLLATARELGVQIVAYSPLGRGLLTGQYKSPDEFEDGDFLKAIPRYSAENFPNILKLEDGLKAIGAKYNNATAGQVALAWLLAQGDDIIPIPGTKKIKYLAENFASAKLTLSAEDVQAVRDIAAEADTSQGDRYPAGMQEMLFVDTSALA